MSLISDVVETPILKMNHSELEKWWDEYKAPLKGWAYLEDASFMLLTTAYATSVVNKEIPASKEVINACWRHLRDLKRQDDPDFPWTFDEDKAWRPIRFIEEKIKPSKGHFTKMVIQPFQHFFIGSTFGWVNKRTGLRRFRESVIFMARKNGKTAILSGLASYMAGFDHENGPEVYALANSQLQSRILYEETTKMIDASPYLSERFRVTRSEITYPKSNGKIVALSAEKKAKDGFNLHFGVFDEIHEYEDYTLINVMKRSRGQRRQPLIMYISTAGYVLDGPMMDFYLAGKECLEKYDENIDEQTFYYLAKLDDEEEINNPLMWIKANPNIAMMDGVALIEDFKKDRRSPQEYADWVTKQFNLFSESNELSFVTNEIIMKNDDVIDETQLANMPAVAGFDLSETEDFTAAAIEVPLSDNRVFIKVHSFIPKTRYNRDEKKARLDQWINNDELTVIPGDYVNYEYVYRWFLEQQKRFNIIQINYDPAKSLFLNKSLQEHGFNTQVTRQGFLTLGGPMQNFKELLLDGRVVFNNQHMFRWYLSNVKLVKDRNDNWMPTKQSKIRKIDGFAAALNAHVKCVDMLVAKQSQSRVGFISLKDLM